MNKPFEIQSVIVFQSITEEIHLIINKRSYFDVDGRHTIATNYVFLFFLTLVSC